MHHLILGLDPGRAMFGAVTEPETSARWEFPRPYGEYQLLERIGQGGMAEVFRARRGGAAGFEKIVVIKRILPHLAEQDRFVRMFVNEAKIAAQIQHQNVVQVFDLGQHEGGELFIAMEHVSGEDLRKLLASAEEHRWYLPVWFSLHVVREVLTALAHAHELTDASGRKLQIVHRDVTPANIFISYQGEVKLADFGIAKAIGENPDTEAGQVKGNVSYMSPEALLGDPLDARADVFSAGVVLWEALAQQRLFNGRSNFEIARVICDSERPPPSRLNPEVPPELDAIVLKALEIDPPRRFQSAHDMLVPIVDVLSRLKPRLVRSEVREVVGALCGRVPPPAEVTTRTPRTAAGEWPALPSPTRTPGGDLPPIAAFGISPATTGRGALPGLPIPGATQQMPPAAVPVAPMIAPSSSAGVALSGASAILTGDGRLEIPDSSDVINDLLDWATSSTAAVEPSLELEYGKGPSRGRLKVRDPKGNVSGPYGYSDLVNYRGTKPSEISADGTRWMDIRTFVQISGIDRLAPNPLPLRRVTMVGKIENRSVCSLFAQLGKERSSGRLVLMESGHRDAARREIYVLRGAPVFVYSDHPTLQLPSLLSKHEIVREDQLDELIAQVVERQKPLLDLVPWHAFTDLNRYWPLMMRDRLVEVFRWGSGRFAFDADAEPPRSTPFARSLLQVLTEGVHRSFNISELSSMLAPKMTAKLQRAESFASILRLLSLTEKQTELANRLGARKTLGELLRKSSGDTHPQLVLAYVLLEAGALVAP